MLRVDHVTRRGAVLVLLVSAIAVLGARFAKDDDDPGPFIADPADWICGLGDPRQLTAPAKVDYQKLMEATPQIREMRRQGIDPESARGVILRSRAQAEVKRACDVVRRELEHCSVWRAIRRRDGGPIPDRTEEVLAEIRTEEPPDDRGPHAER